MTRDRPRGLVGRAEGGVAVGPVGLDDGDDLGRVDPQVGVAYPLHRVGQLDRATVRRQLGAVVDVVEALELARLPVVDLEDHPVGLVEPGLVVADRAARHEQAVGQHRGDLDYGDVEVAVEAEPHVLGGVAQVRVDVVDLAGVDQPAHRRVGVVRQAGGDPLRLREDAVGVGRGRRPGPQPDAEVLAPSVRRDHPVVEGGGDRLGVAGPGEPAHPDVVAGADVLDRPLRCRDARAQERADDTGHGVILSGPVTTPSARSRRRRGRPRRRARRPVPRATTSPRGGSRARASCWSSTSGD